MFLLFCCFKNTRCLQKFGANHTSYTNKLFKKKRNSASVEVSLHGYLIIAKQRFTLISADAIELSYYPENLEIHPHRLQIIAHCFRLLCERSEKFALAKT